MNTKLHLIMALYLLIVFIVLYLKPIFIFNNDCKMEEFGTGKNKTLYPLWLVFLLAAIFSYYFILLVF